MITDEMIRRAKSLELPDLIRRRNIDLIPLNGGSAYKCKCPFHEDKNPSLNLNFKDGLWLWNCFGCGAGGTVIDFVMKFEKMDFKTAVQSVVRPQDSQPGRFPAVEKSVSRKIKIPDEVSLFPDFQQSNETRKELLSLITEHYHQNLMKGDDKGRAYIEKRGLLDEEIIKTFKLGYSNNNAKDVFKKQRMALREELGIFKENYWETFAGSVIFPVLDQEGNPTDLYARRTINYSDRSTHCYNKGRHEGIFNIVNVKDAESIILTEGIIDALSIYKAGFKNVTALYGVNGFTEGHRKLLSNGTVKKVILALDNDEAGKSGVKRIAEELNGLVICSVELPEGIKDINELYLKQGIEAVQKVINESVILKARVQEVVEVSPAEERIIKALETERIEYSFGFSDRAGNIFDAAREKPEGAKVEVLEMREDGRFSFNGLDLSFRGGVVSYVVRGVGKLKSLDNLKFAVIASMNGQDYRDTVDFYRSRSRRMFENEAAKYFNIQMAVIEKDLSLLTSFIESEFRERKSGEGAEKKAKYKMTEEEAGEALAFLKSKGLTRRIVEDISILGYVGDDMNKLLLYLGGTSRVLDKPLSILIRSMSATGKSYLIKLICSMMPPEDLFMWTGATRQALYYLPDDELKHKILAVDEKEGMKDAEYPIRSLLSEGRLAIAVPMKNPVTGKIVTEQIIKDGPIAYVDGSTDTRTNPENANRCFEIFLDESIEQTKRIQGEQTKSHTLEGMVKSGQKEAIRRIHRNAQRLLKTVKVVIPYVEKIEFPTDWIRTRRDHDRFLNLIVCIAFLHQYQRERKELNGKPYIEATLEDYGTAYKLAQTVLFNTFQELEKPIHDFYAKLLMMVEANAKLENVDIQEYWFTRRTVRAFTKLPDYLVKRYMRVLKDLEYFEVKSHGHGAKDFYQLAKIMTRREDLKGLTTPSELKRKLLDTPEGKTGKSVIRKD